VSDADWERVCVSLGDCDGDTDCEDVPDMLGVDVSLGELERDRELEPLRDPDMLDELDDVLEPV